PSHLSAASQRIWATVVDGWELEAHELALLERALGELDRAEQARQAIAKEGAVVEGRYGPRASPWVAIERDSTALAGRLFRQLDLDATPPPGPLGRRRGGGAN